MREKSHTIVALAVVFAVAALLLPGNSTFGQQRTAAGVAQPNKEIQTSASGRVRIAEPVRQQQRKAEPPRGAKPAGNVLQAVAQPLAAAKGPQDLGELKTTLWDKLRRLALDMFSGNEANFLSGNKPDLLSKNDTELLSGNCPKLLSENNPKLLSGNSPKLLSENQTPLCSGNRFSLFSDIKLEIHIDISNSGNNNGHPEPAPGDRARGR
jgi:hypothetical protein